MGKDKTEAFVKPGTVIDLENGWVSVYYYPDVQFCTSPLPRSLSHLVTSQKIKEEGLP
jgi:hypothetical protein